VDRAGIHMRDYSAWSLPRVKVMSIFLVNAALNLRVP
jgi:hypothetical protein